MSTSADWRAGVGATWDAAVGHRFVEELWAGEVDEAVMARYLGQDAQFLDAFVALLGAAVACCDRTAPRMALARQLGVVAGEEDDYFDRALARLGVDPAGVEHAAPTRGFVALMDQARCSGDYATILAVLVVAEWLYLDWASRPGPGPTDWLHREWVDLHRGEAFAAFVALLRTELDRVAGPGDHRAREAFTRAVDLELAFFDAAYGVSAGAPR